MPFAYLIINAYRILIDSGGIKEESLFLGNPALVMCDTIERAKTVNAGMVQLVGADVVKIIDAVTWLLTDKNGYLAMCRPHTPYRDKYTC